MYMAKLHLVASQFFQVIMLGSKLMLQTVVPDFQPLLLLEHAADFLGKSRQLFFSRLLLCLQS